MTDTVLARLAALKTAADPAAEAAMARALRDRAAALQPALPRKPARLPDPGTGLRRAEARDAEAAASSSARSSTAAIPSRRRQPPQDRPIAGTRLIREWQGVEHCVTVRDDGLRVSGPALQIAVGDRPRHHRHALERAGCSSASRTSEARVMKKPVVRKLRCAVYTRKSSEEGLEQEFNSPRCPARGLRGLHRQPEGRGLGAGARPLRRRRHLRRHAGAACAEAAARRHRGRPGRRRGGLQDRPAQPRR